MQVQTHDEMIEGAKATLRIAEADFTRLPHDQAQLIIHQIEEKFVDGHNWH